ncbi:hypothetical protein LP090_02415 [Moraxella bovis]|uniref:hypothetical protein n=1 Tax=Moraxella bovis TaxID=476 RepID=UPI0022277373|nr:hypothetical protein [Moraxella bovis]UZA43478.1 hypothetical protein LP090_02415 [Moraxella bovis]
MSLSKALISNTVLSLVLFQEIEPSLKIANLLSAKPHYNKPITHSAINGIIQNNAGQVKTDHFARALHWVQQVGWGISFEFVEKDR